MNIKEYQSELINEIYNSWRGLYLSGDMAMYDIGKVLRNTVVMKKGNQLSG